MRITVLHGGRQYAAEVPWEVAKVLIDSLKRAGARFDPQAKTWSAPVLPCDVAKAVGAGQCSDGKFWKSFYYHFTPPPEDVLKRHFCFKVERWRRATCQEYCEEKCAGADYPEICVDKCESRCEEEGWEPRVKKAEEVCLYKVENGVVRVPRGLALRLASALSYAELPPLGNFEGLRDYQAEVAKSAWAQLQKIGAATVQMATGAGKSYMAGYLAKRLEEAGYKVFVIALQLDLVRQMAEFAAKFGARPTAVTVQTLWNRLREAGYVKEDWRNGDDDEEGEVLKAYADESDAPEGLAEEFVGKKTAVIIDEVHHLPARTVKTVAMLAGDGEALRIGLSATPWRNDGRDLEIYAYTGDVVEPRISSSYLIQRGFAVPVDIYMVELGDWGCRGGTYAEVRRCLAESDKRNKLIAELVEKAPKPALVLTPLVRHAETLGGLIPGAEVATGAVKGEARAEIYRRVREGKVRVLVATTIADEGLDLPPLRSAVFTLGGRSKTRVLQRVGRLVRPWPGKNRAVVYDLWDSADYFKRQGEERVRLYKTEPAWRVEVVKP